MQWTKDKKIALSITIGFLVIAAPFWLIMASNAGAGILSWMRNREPTQAELIGNYTYTAKWGTAELHLSPDETFTETVTEHGSTPKRHRGTWTADSDENSAKITFRPFDMVWDDNHGTETDIFAMNFYKSRFGKTHATVNSDLGEQFEQQ